MPRNLSNTTLLLLILLALTACSGEAPQNPSAPPEAYQVQGLIRHLPDADRPVQEILIHHEAIPNFKDDEGHVVGMNAMSMPFPITDRSMIEGLAAGDKIDFEFEVSFGGSPGLRLTRIEKLPPETELDFKTKGSSPGATHEH